MSFASFYLLIALTANSASSFVSSVTRTKAEKIFRLPSPAVDLTSETSLRTWIVAEPRKSVRSSFTEENVIDEKKEELLTAIDEITNGLHCADKVDASVKVSLLPARLRTTSSSQLSNGEIIVFIPSDKSGQRIPSEAVKSRYKLTVTRVRFLSSLLAKYNPEADDYDLLRKATEGLGKQESDIYQVRSVWLQDQKPDTVDLRASYYVDWGRKRNIRFENYNVSIKKSKPWLKLVDGGLNFTKIVQRGFVEARSPADDQSDIDAVPMSNWTQAYYACDSKLWLLSYTSLVTHFSTKSNALTLKGLISVDLNINKLDVNQCDIQSENGNGNVSNRDFTLHLFSTHKCHRMSSEVSVT